MRRLLSQAPEPRSAVNISCRIGSKTTPTSISPACSSASVTLKIGKGVREIGGAVERVHIPAIFRRTGVSAAFLGHNAVRRKIRPQPLDDQFPDARSATVTRSNSPFSSKGTRRSKKVASNAPASRAISTAASSGPGNPALSAFLDQILDLVFVDKQVGTVFARQGE
jgi:hypothetical protein